MAVILIHIPEYGCRASWFFLYAFGYYVASVKKYDNWALGVIVMGVLVWLMTMFSWEEIMLMSDSWSMAFHIAGAIVIFLFGMILITSLKVQRVVWPVKDLDKYSFQIYIVHHVLIMKPFGMLWITGNVVVNVIVIIGYIIFYTWVLYTCENQLEIMLNRIHSRKYENRNRNNMV